jgi:hypothetical protein
MGSAESKLDFKQSVIELTAQASKVDDNTFWERFWTTVNAQSAKDIFTIITAADIRDLKRSSPSNLSTICYKSVEYLRHARDSSCPVADHKKVNLL